LGEAGADGLAGAGICGVAQELTIGGAVLDVDQCVAAVEDGERRERVEACLGAVEARGAGGDGGAGEAAEGLSGGLLAAAGEDEADGWVLALMRVARAASRLESARRRRLAAACCRWRRSSRR
jgi:hypothetical protein